ncbi:MAG: WXG100 family type VII secretion target [Butyrivibrio sp.]|nr:WXG100 family type VII secretion target [Butyrivibrio sp.]
MEIINLRVTPEQLKAQKGIIDQDINNIRNDIEGIKSELAATESYWFGSAATKERKIFQDSMQKVTEMMNRLDTYPARILQMAGIYETTEENNVAKASQLTTSIQMI